MAAKGCEEVVVKGREGKEIEGAGRKVKKDLLFAEEVYQIMGAAMEVHRTLGHGFLEGVYQEALSLELQERRIPFAAQVPLDIHFKTHVLQKKYIADFIVFGEIVVEIKSCVMLTGRETAQLLNYLFATGKTLGLLINFGSSGKLEWKRIAHTISPSRSF